ITNPPSNPELLDSLAQDFVRHQFDLKYLVRTICTSETYQRSSTPNAFNQKDRQNFARSYPRRLPAEVILDAIDQVTGVPTKFNSNEAARAVELADEAVPSTLLEVFGKPSRDSACECERVSSATLTQSLFLIASRDLHGKLRQSTSRAGKWAADPRPDAD